MKGSVKSKLGIFVSSHKSLNTPFNTIKHKKVSETADTVRFNQTLPKVWVDAIQKLVKTGYCKNTQAFVEEAVREKVLPLLQVEKKGEN